MKTGQEWNPISSMPKDGDFLMLFDNNEVRPFSDSNWPFAVATHWKFLQQDEEPQEQTAEGMKQQISDLESALTICKASREFNKQKWQEFDSQLSQYKAKLIAELHTLRFNEDEYKEHGQQYAYGHTDCIADIINLIKNS